MTSGAPMWIGDEGAKAIAEALKYESNKVNTLYLQYNQIGVERAMAIAEALKRENNKVKHLRLGGNENGNEGAKALLEALKHENCIATHLFANDISSIMCNEAIRIRKLRTSLFVLLSAREVRRNRKNAPVRKLPSDLIRLVAGMLPIKRRGG